MRISDWSSDVCSSDLSSRIETVMVAKEARAPIIQTMALKGRAAGCMRGGSGNDWNDRRAAAPCHAAPPAASGLQQQGWRGLGQWRELRPAASRAGRGPSCQTAAAGAQDEGSEEIR